MGLDGKEVWINEKTVAVKAKVVKDDNLWWVDR